jgi:hypothetical protein
MSLRERLNDRSDQQRENPGPQGGPAGNLSELRLAGAEILAAADDAINRVLSGNSEAFNTANRQQGGQ